MNTARLSGERAWFISYVRKTLSISKSRVKFRGKEGV